MKNISLTTITGYTGSSGVLLNAQGNGLESAGFIHRLKSFFGIGDAREKNRETLNALKEAVLSDSRFNTLDLRDQVERLFAKERTCFAVDMSRIRGIIGKMATLANRQDIAMLDKRVDLHMAVIHAFSPDQKDFAADVTRLVKQQVRKAAADGGRGPVPVADIASEVCGRGVVALMEIGDLPRDRDPALVKVIGRNLRQFAVHLNGTLLSSEAVTNLVGDTCAFYRRAKAVADGQVEGVAWSGGGNAERVGRHVSAALEFMDTVGRPLKPYLFDDIHDYVCHMAGSVARSLGPRPTKDQVHSMVDDLPEDMSISFSYDMADDGPVFPGDSKANKALAHYIAKSMELELSDTARQAICKNLHVKSASEVFEPMAYDAIRRA